MATVADIVHSSAIGAHLPDRRALTPTHRITVVVAGVTPQPIEQQLTREKWRQAITQLKAGDLVANIEAALDMGRALLSAHHGQMHLLTDRGRAIYERWREKSGGNHLPLTIHAFGKNEENVSIAAFAIYQSLFSEDYRETQAYLNIRNHTASDKTVNYHVSLEGKRVLQGTREIPADGQATIVIKGFDGPGLVSAKVDFDDALLADNEAFAFITPIRPLRFLVVAKNETLKGQLEKEFSDRGAKIQFFNLTPTETQQVGQSALEQDYDEVVFDAPSSTGESFKLPAVIRNGGTPSEMNALKESYYKIVDWNTEHELMRYLENFNIPFVKAAARVPQAEWIEPVIEGLLGDRFVGGGDLLPVVSAGVSEGRRSVYLGFDLKEYNLTKYQHLKILLLNILLWLHPHKRMPANVFTGMPYVLAGVGNNQPMTLMKPSGETVTFPAGTRLIEGSYLDEMGRYRISDSSHFSHQFAAQIVDDRDEFILTVDPEKIWRPPLSASHISWAKEGYANLSYWAFAFAFLFVLLELILFLLLSHREQGLIQRNSAFSMPDFGRRLVFAKWFKRAE